MRKTLSILFLLAVALCGQASAQLSQCAITATIYDNNGDLLSGARIVVVKVVKNGSLISNTPLPYTTNASGVATFNLPRSSVAWIWANSYGLNANGSAGVAVTVPNAASANLEELAAFSSVLTTLGDLAYGGASGVFTRLAGNTSATAKFLCQQGNGTTSTAPGWCAFAGSGNLTLTYDNNARTATFGYTPSSSELLTALGSQSANRVLASPDGSSGTVSVRALVAADIPNLASVYQPLDSDLTAIAALSPSNDDIIQRKAGAWTNRTIAQVKSDFGLATIATSGSASDLGSGSLALARIAQGGATSGQALSWDGSAWAPATIVTAPAGSGSELQFRNSGAFAAVSGSSVSGSDVGLTGKITFGHSANATFIELSPIGGSVLSGKQYFSHDSTANAAGAPNNEVLWWGYNVASGSRVLTGETGLAFSIEGHFQPTYPGDSYTEAHLHFFNSSGTPRRLISWTATKETEAVTTFMSHSVLELRNVPNTRTWAKWNGGELTLQPFSDARGLKFTDDGGTMQIRATATTGLDITSGFSYVALPGVVLYPTTVGIGATMQPLSAGTYDLGTIGSEWRSFYANTSFLIGTDAATAINGNFDGRLGFGVTTSAMSGTNVIALKNGTAPSANIANTALLYAASGELQVRNASGGINKLSGVMEAAVASGYARMGATTTNAPAVSLRGYFANFNGGGAINVINDNVSTTVPVLTLGSPAYPVAVWDTSGNVKAYLDTTGAVYAEGAVTIGAGAAITKVLTGTGSLNFAQASANACETLTLTVTNAADGDVIELGIPHALANHNTTATFAKWRSASNTVSVRRCVISADGSDPAAATVRATVIQH